jgi:hypothetical protein
MKYLEKSFSSGPNSKQFRDNWETVFGKREELVAELPSLTDLKELIETHAKDNNLSKDEAFNDLLKDKQPSETAPIETLKRKVELKKKEQLQKDLDKKEEEKKQEPT